MRPLRAAARFIPSGVRAAAFSLFFREVISHSFLFGERRRFWERFSLFFREVISHSSLFGERRRFTVAVLRIRKEAWVFGNGSSSVLGEGTVQFNLFPYNYCCSPSYPKRGLGLWERFSLFFREVISHSSRLG